MFTNLALRTVLKSFPGVLRETRAMCCAASVKPWTCSSVVSRFVVGCGSFTAQPPVRHYARGPKKKVEGHVSQTSGLLPTMMKMDYAALPLAQTADDVVKRILSLELAYHKEKVHLIQEQLIAKVQQDKNDRSSLEVRVAILTVRIRSIREHVLKHRKDKANKRLMLMAIDQRNKLLKRLRRVHYEAFERVCEQLGITYTLPPEYHRKASRRWLAKKAFVKKVFQEVQKLKAEQRLKKKEESLATTETQNPKTEAAENQ
ncbi:small ribosomal subunit protein uS15m [Aulostomus maculatus]